MSRYNREKVDDMIPYYMKYHSSIIFEQWNQDVQLLLKKKRITCKYIRTYIIGLVDWTKHTYIVVASWRTAIEQTRRIDNIHWLRPTESFPCLH